MTAYEALVIFKRCILRKKGVSFLMNSYRWGL